MHMYAYVEPCCITLETASELRASIPEEAHVLTLAELFRVLGDPTRVRILSVLAQESMCVKDLSAVVEMQQAAVSQQLRVLRHNRLVKYRKDGKMAVYSLDDEHVDSLFKIGLEHVRGDLE
jgi:DNA-binding transcriptional ArsR family regulator